MLMTEILFYKKNNANLSALGDTCPVQLTLHTPPKEQKGNFCMPASLPFALSQGWLFHTDTMSAWTGQSGSVDQYLWLPMMVTGLMSPFWWSPHWGFAG